MCTLTRRLTLKVQCEKFAQSLHCIYGFAYGFSSQLLYQICVQKTGNTAIVLVLQINMIAHFTILFFLIVLRNFVQTPQVLCM